MFFNRRQKLILFLTLALSGCALLSGADLKQAIGFLMVGAATAWILGSSSVSKACHLLKSASNEIFFWSVIPLGMSVAGALLAVALMYSQANPVAVVVVGCAVGISLARLTRFFSTKNIYKDTALFCGGTVAFFIFLSLVLSIDPNASGELGEKYGRLAGVGLFIIFAAYSWLDEGLELVKQGITATSENAPATTLPSKNLTSLHYVSLFFGLTVLVLWLGLLTWSASSYWQYPSETKATEEYNPLAQLMLVGVLASWPYLSWRAILRRELNCDAKYLRRHRILSALVPGIFVIFISAALMLGTQNGDDRLLQTKLSFATTDLRDTITRIADMKHRNLKTTEDYVRAYAQIDNLLPDFEVKIDQCEKAIREGQRTDERRGFMNVQLFYRTHTPKTWQNSLELLDNLRRSLLLSKKEVATARRMAALPAADQVNFWKAHFRPLLSQDDDLQNRLRSIAAKFRPGPG